MALIACEKFNKILLNIHKKKKNERKNIILSIKYIQNILLIFIKARKSLGIVNLMNGYIIEKRNFEYLIIFKYLCNCQIITKL